MSANSQLGRFSRLFFLFGVIPLLFIAGVQLFILSEQTDRYFAWTIPLPLTAAFMGAGYWAALAHALILVREPSWKGARASVPAGLTATTLLLIATVWHLNQFHLDSTSFITRFVTWVWIIVYVITPPIFLYFLVKGFRAPAEGNERRMPFSSWVRTELLLLAAFGLIFGLGLFFLPGSFMPLWPWKVPPLASRAVGAWLTTFGVAAATIAWQNDRINTRGALASLFAFGILQLVVLLRYPGSVNFGNPLAWGYFLFLLLDIAASGSALLRRS